MTPRDEARLILSGVLLFIFLIGSALLCLWAFVPSTSS
jgi:hypothetical protein